MAQSKFTKGPWGVIHYCGSGPVRTIVAGGKDLAVVRNAHVYLAEIEANAELMADAPRLLEILRTFHDFSMPLRARFAEESERVFADARALLEKHGG